MVTKQSLELGNLVTGEDNIKCPLCGEDYLHQGKVEVYRRHKEDSPNGQHVSVLGQSVRIGRSMKGNPSNRRDGLKIYFSCEMCSPSLEEPVGALCIEQHKGNEFVYWELAECIEE